MPQNAVDNCRGAAYTGLYMESLSWTVLGAGSALHASISVDYLYAIACNTENGVWAYLHAQTAPDTPI